MVRTPRAGHRIDDHFANRCPYLRGRLIPSQRLHWEGTGVEPDVKVKAAGALATAEKLAESHLRNR